MPTYVCEDEECGRRFVTNQSVLIPALCPECQLRTEWATLNADGAIDALLKKYEDQRNAAPPAEPDQYPIIYNSDEELL